MRTSSGMWMPRRTPRRPSIGFCSRSASTRREHLALVASVPSSPSGRSPSLQLQPRLELGDLAQQLVVARQELVQRRIDQADGHRQPVHRAEQAVEVARAASAAASRAPRRAPPRPARGSSAARSAAARPRRTCARCGTGRCPRRRSRARARRRAGSRRWPRRRACGCRRPTEQLQRSGSSKSGTTVGSCAGEHLAGGAVERDAVALARAVRPSTVQRAPRRRPRSPSTPTTAGLPNWRATSAAWLVRPPRLVRTPRAASMPCTSSGLVSGRTMMTSLLLASAQRSAMSASKASTPTAAPGETLRPVAISSPRAFAPSCWPAGRTAGGGRSRRARA